MKLYNEWYTNILFYNNARQHLIIIYMLMAHRHVHIFMCTHKHACTHTLSYTLMHTHTYIHIVDIVVTVYIGHYIILHINTNPDLCRYTNILQRYSYIYIHMYTYKNVKQTVLRPNIFVTLESNDYTVAVTAGN